MTKINLNLDYARKGEGYYYGDGAAMLAERVAKAAHKYKTAKRRAEAVYDALCTFAKECGHNPKTKCFMRPREGGYRVSYEAGPYEWAIVASDALGQIGIFAEPYYSFDLCFYVEVS